MSDISAAISCLTDGRPVILVDDEARENEGDLVLAAEHASGPALNFMIKHGRGLVCLALDGAIVDRLGLPPMADVNEAKHKTAFTVSIEARHGVSTGISARDRARTIRTAIAPGTAPRDIVSPGHVFPLRAADGGVLSRNGHTEGAVDLMRIAGLTPAAVICEIMDDAGEMARRPALDLFARQHDIPILSIADIAAHRIRNEKLVEQVAVARLPTIHSDEEFKIHAFRSLVDGREYAAITKGNLEDDVLVRVHSECVTGDVFGSSRCDCGLQLRQSLARISAAGAGVLVHVCGHEGRGIGLANKIRAYALQDEGLDTVEANRELGFADDLRDYAAAAQILKAFGLKSIRLLSNNPAKTESLEKYGIKISAQVPLLVESSPHNARYLTAKREKMGHCLPQFPNVEAAE